MRCPNDLVNTVDNVDCYVPPFFFVVIAHSHMMINQSINQSVSLLKHTTNVRASVRIA